MTDTATCPKCQKVVLADFLTRHKRGCTTKRTACPVCGRPCRPSSLSLHMQAHTPEREQLTKEAHEALQRGDDVIRIPLTQGKVALVDAADAKNILAFNWSCFKARTGRWYVQRYEDDGTWHGMGGDILGLPGGRRGKKHVVDHINGDPLDNRRSNLRYVTSSVNCQNKRNRTIRNTSGYLGVYFKKAEGVWEASTYKGRKRFYIGRFDTKEEAALAYNKAVLEIFGENAALNEVPAEKYPEVKQ